MARPLTESENHVLGLIREHYGPHNAPDAIMWAEDEAVLWVKDRSGAAALMANLTNLARWRSDGTIGSDEELMREWFRIQDV